MKRAELSQLKDVITALARGSQVGSRILSIDVGAEDTLDTGAFLRVLVTLDDLTDLEPENVEPLIESIEQGVAQIDERYPSVRFTEAA